MSREAELKAHLADILSFPPCRRCGMRPELVTYSAASDPGLFQIVARCRCRSMAVDTQEVKADPRFLPEWTLPSFHVLSSLRAKWDAEAGVKNS